jgi:hypothetical protein
MARRGMLRLKTQQILQYLPGLLRVALTRVKAREVQVRLIEIRRQSDAGPKLLLCFGIVTPSRKQYAKIIQSLWIIRTQIDRLLQVMSRLVSLVLQRVLHDQTVVHLRIVWFKFDRPSEQFFGFVIVAHAAIQVAQI